ncbi:uncharacterized protein LOC134667795 [Cydia fagiglandana]|uniref:uncharacterized protein LOC134667795 n=1 Tax=Cydia fagiglandana TaxID=1458189 RepID=UPI002FEE133C
MEQVLSTLQEIQKELNEQKTTIRESGKNVTEQVTQNINTIIDEKFVKWEEKYDILKEKVDTQEKRLCILEKQARQRNLIFFGIEENNLPYSEQENAIISFIEEHFKIELDRKDIQAFRRLGVKKDRPRPIGVTFSTLGTKINILKNKKMLNNTGYYITEDFPPNILEKRRELQTQLKMENANGNKAFIKYDKLVIVGKSIDMTSNKKRNLQISPENNQRQNDYRTQVSKKNKTQPMHSPLQRPQSVSETVLKPGILNYLVNKNPNNKEKQDTNL